MKNKFLNIFIFIFLVFSLVGCAGEMGPQGPQGEQGIQGIQGEQGQPGKDGVDGQNGVNGKDGTSLLTGNGEPTSVIGIVGDSYIDLDTWSFYIKTTNGWVISGNIKGEKGDSGVIEYDGTEGLEFYPINDEKCGVSVGRAFLQENIVIPSLYNGRKVTQIIYEGFAGCSNLVSITLPETLETLDANAFNYCSNLENVYYKGTIDKWCNIVANNASFESSPMYYADNFYMLDENKEWYCLEELIIPDNVETIYPGVFSNFNNIKDLTLPSSVTYIGTYAFEYCEGLENVYYDGTVEDWCNILFEKGWSSSTSNPMRYADNIYFLDDNGNVEHNGKKYSTLKEVIIPNTINRINNEQFYNFSDLEKVIIPDSVESIGTKVFYNCNNIKSLQIPFIGATKEGTSNNYLSYLFGAGSYSSENYVPESLKEIVVTGGETLGKGAFYNCNNIEKIILPNTLTSIDQTAFYACSSLKNIVIPNSVTSIGEDAFAYCRSLTSIEIPNSVTSIGEDAFAYCSSLTSIEIPNNILSIGLRAFYECTSLASVEFEENSKLSLIDSHAFYNCTSLTSIEIPSSVTKIGYATFKNCNRLEKIEVPFVGETEDGTSNTNFGYIFGASSYDSNSSSVPESLKEVIITGGTTIPSRSFSYCSSIETIILPDSLDIIGYYAFNHCSSIETIILPNSLNTIEQYAFNDCSNLINIVIPSSVTAIEYSAFCGCIGLISIVIPEGVTNIESDVFSNCSSLIIYCESSSKPNDWSYSWNTLDRPVYWAGQWEYDANGNPIPLS